MLANSVVLWIRGLASAQRPKTRHRLGATFSTTSVCRWTMAVEAGTFEDRAIQVCPRHPDASEIGALEQRTAHLDPLQVQSREIVARQIGRGEICAVAPMPLCLQVEAAASVVI